MMTMILAYEVFLLLSAGAYAAQIPSLRFFENPPISVELSPQFVETFNETTATPESSVTISCKASGMPLPEISWNLHGIPIETGDHIQIFSSVDKDGFALSSLQINKTNVKDGGVYSCVATNDVGQAEHAKRINVYGLLGSREVPQKMGVTGGNIILNCPVYGFPIKDIVWMKENPRNVERRQNFINGSLGIAGVTKYDSGAYKCTAISEYGQRVKALINVTVMDPPKIAPFEFDDELRGGMSAKLICRVTSDGDLPINISWIKDGRPIPSHLGVLVHESTPASTSYRHYHNPRQELSSFLNISSITAGANGKYTCIATNQASRVRHTAALFVHVPPRWIISPKNADVIKGNDVRLHCQADGFPKPEIVWLKSNDTNHETFPTKIYNNSNTIIYPNGTLFLQNTDSEDQGFYFCQTSNGIGEEIRVTAEVKINVPPFFKDIQSEINAPIGKEVQLRCRVQGDAPLMIMWDKAGEVLENMQSRHRIETTNSATDTVSLLKISNASRDDQGIYVCHAKNQYGNNITTIKIIVKKFPDPPYDAKIVSSDNRSVELTWKSPMIGNGPIQKYIVQYKKAEDSWDQANSTETKNGELTNCIVTDLNPATSYLFRLFAKNSQGLSSPTATLRITTNEEIPPRWIISPENVTEVMQGNDVKLHCQADGYPKPDIVWLKANETKYETSTKICNNSNTIIYPNGTLFLQNTDSEDQGFYSCRASNGIGEAIRETAEVKINAPPFFKHIESEINAPIGKAVQLRCWVQSNALLRIKWFKDGEVQAGHRIETINSSSDAVSLLKIINASRDDQGIYVCHAENQYGNKNTTIKLIVKKFPDPPFHTKIVSSNSRSVELTWKSPIDGNGPIQKYIIQYKKAEDSWNKANATETKNGELTNCIVTDLNPGTGYLFRLFAENSEGLSSPTVPLQITTNEDKTVSPDLMSDSADDPMVCPTSYMNFYIVVPIICTAIILLAILGAACFYLKMKRREQDDDLAPYATFQSSKKGDANSLGINAPSPLPPAKVEGFQNDVPPSVNLHF